MPDGDGGHLPGDHEEVKDDFALLYECGLQQVRAMRVLQQQASNMMPAADSHKSANATVELGLPAVMPLLACCLLLAAGAAAHLQACDDVLGHGIARGRDGAQQVAGVAADGAHL